MKKIIWVILFSTFLLAQSKIEVGIEEKLNAQLPMDMEFVNSDGKTYKLKDIFDKPVLLTFVYYGCPGICSPLLGEVAEKVNEIDLKPGIDYKLVTISFNHREDSEIARVWRDRYYSVVKKELGENDWMFFTGDSQKIRQITDIAGFYFKPDGIDYIHAGALFAVTPEGKISRYLFGTDFNPFDVKMALIDAKSGKSNPAVSKFLQFCYSYDPVGRAYTLNITRIIGAIMLLGVGIFFTILVIKKKKKVTVDKELN